MDIKAKITGLSYKIKLTNGYCQNALVRIPDERVYNMSSENSVLIDTLFKEAETNGFIVKINSSL